MKRLCISSVLDCWFENRFLHYVLHHTICDILNLKSQQRVAWLWIFFLYRWQNKYFFIGSFDILLDFSVERDYVIWKVNVHGIQLSTSELSPVICIRLHQPFRKIVQPDLKASEKNGQTTTTFANFFLWLTRLITNSLEFTSNFNISSVFNFQIFFFCDTFPC